MLKKTYSVLLLALICMLSLCVFAFSACSQGSIGSDNPSSSSADGSSGNGGSASLPDSSGNSSSSGDSSSSSSGGSGVLCADGVHDYGEFIVQVEPNCYRAGEEYRVCSRCNYHDYREIEKTNEHKKVPIPEVKPTCSSNGLTEGERCEVCGEVFVIPQSIERLPHTEEVIPALEATCTTFGHTAGKKCSVCDEIIEKPEFIDDGHTYPVYGTGEIRCNFCGRLKPIGGLVFELDEETDTYIITKCEDYYDIRFFSIPMFHEGKVVSKIGESAFSYKSIHKLEIPETIVEIGKEAFVSVLGPTDVKIFGKTRIGEKVFDHSELENIEMPNVTYIGKEAFTGCYSLKEIKGVTASVIDEKAFENCPLLNFVEFCEGVTEIRGEAFAYSSVKSIVIPSSVVSIAGNAFDYYSSSPVVYYKGTAAELDLKPQVKGVIGGNTVYYYSEAEPALNESGDYDGNFWYYGAKKNVVVWKKK